MTKPLHRETQDSMISDASDNGTRRLAVVFFDILMLNGGSFLDTPYNERRSRLEEIISCRPGYAMLAERIQLDISSAQAAAQVQTVFARRCAEFEGKSRCLSSVLCSHLQGRGLSFQGERWALQRLPVSMGEAQEG